MATLTAPAPTAVLADITKRAMLVDLNIHQLSFLRFDADVSRQVANQHQAEASVGRYNKKLIDKQYLDPITRAASALRREHDSRTLPWSQSGPRILLSKGYFDYVRAMNPLQSEFQQRVRDFVDNYDQYRTASLVKMGSLASLADYPPVDEVAGCFSVGINILPFQDANDFRVDLGGEETELIRQQIEDNIKNSIQEASKEPLRRIKEVVGYLVERLTAYEEKVRADRKGREGSFTDSLVRNVKDLVALLPSLNVTDDPYLEDVAKRMDIALCGFSPQELRDSTANREFVIDNAKQIMSQLEDLI